MGNLSVIIPVGPNDGQWVGFLEQVKKLPPDWEIIFSGASELTPTDLLKFESLKPMDHQCRWVSAGRANRGAQLNHGAMLASGDWLWFVHVDSYFDLDVPNSIKKIAVRDDVKRLYYFRLGFFGKKSLMKLNQWGANFRSRVLGMPFGDQGFLIDKKLFWQAGGYPEGLPLGEDHSFVWKLRRLGIELICLPEVLWTSSRKYEERGWLKTTIRYNYLTYKQALPEIWKWLAKRGKMSP